MFSLSTSGDCEVEKEKPRILPSMIPNLAHLFAASGGFPGPNPAATNALRNIANSTHAATTTSSSQSPSATATVTPSTTTNNLFPPFLNANFAQYYALMQQQQTQFLAQHFNAAKNNSNNSNGINGSNNSESNSSILSDSRASSTDSSSKKIKVDNDGNVICPICDEKLPNDSNWEKHVEIERKILIKSIESIKEQKQNPENVGVVERSMSSNRSKQKREAELQRIRINQQKRLTLKSINPLTTHRNIENNNFDSTSTTSSRSTSADKNFCKGCERHHDYLIISSTLDEPRCYECFRKFRQQTTFLPLSFTESLENANNHDSAQHRQLTPSAHSVDGLLGSCSTSTNSTLATSNRKRPSSNCSSSNESIKSPSSGINNNEKRFKIEI